MYIHKYEVPCFPTFTQSIVLPDSMCACCPIASDKQINTITTVGEEEEEGGLTSVSGDPLAGPGGQGGGGGAQQQLTSVHQAARHAGAQRLTQHIHG